MQQKIEGDRKRIAEHDARITANTKEQKRTAKKVQDIEKRLEQKELDENRRAIDFSMVSKQMSGLQASQRATAKDVSGLIYGVGKVKLDLAEAKKKC